MADSLVLVCGTLLMVVLESLQKRYAPSTYMEPIALIDAYVLGYPLSRAKVASRLAIPFIVGVVIAFAALYFSPSTSPYLLAGLSCFLGTLVLVYGPLTITPYRQRRAGTRGRVRLFFTIFAVLPLNGGLGALGCFFLYTLNASVAAADLSGVWTWLAAQYMNLIAIIVTIIGSLWARKPRKPA